MKAFSLFVSSLLLCSCADMVVTKTYNSAAASRTEVDAKDFDAKAAVHFDKNCGVAATHPRAIYIRPFCIDGAIFRGDEAASVGEMPIRQALTPVQFAEDLKEELEKIAPARILSDDEVPKLGWLVEGQFDLVDGGDPVARFFFGTFGAGRSHLLLHVRVTDVVAHQVIYEFDVAGGSNLQGHHGTLRASGLGKATPFDLRNAAERILLVLTPDAHRFGARASVALR
jgi:uncharacterized protein DUF4410